MREASVCRTVVRGPAVTSTSPQECVTVGSQQIWQAVERKLETDRRAAGDVCMKKVFVFIGKLSQKEYLLVVCFRFS